MGMMEKMLATLGGPRFEDHRVGRTNLRGIAC
jgi:hypothetical protein